MADPETEPVEAEVVDAELAEAVDDALSSQDLVVAHAGDFHEGLIAMDAHDAARLVERLTRQAQEANLGKRWVYTLPGGKGSGLTIDAVQDITQQMNWTGKCAIGIDPSTLQVEVIEADEGHGDEKFWVATVAAVDRRTGVHQIGTSMEPQNMRLKGGGTKFDRFARTKAIGKAQRNAMEQFIPETVKLTLISMAEGRPELIERIETAAEAKMREMPAPLDTPEAKALTAEMAGIYDEIRGLGGGRGKVLLPPGRYNAALVHAQHDLSALQAMRLWLVERRDEIRVQLEGEEL